MSQAEIDRMAQRAEKCCAESESNKAKIEAKSCLRIVAHYADTLNEE